MDLKPGKYRHFKGNEYELIGVASHSETMEPMVVYRALYGEHGLWVRPAKMFFETIERDGKSMKRFELVREATAMLDPAGRREVLATIETLHRDMGITVVLITHHMDEAILADRVVVMNEGRVAMDGTPTQVFTRVEELEEMGLTVPDTVQLLHRLRAAGYEVPLDALDVESCADAVFGALN